MFVYVLLNTEYMPLDMRKVWYLKLLSHCFTHNFALITHDYLKSNFESLYDSIPDRFFDEFDIPRFNKVQLGTVRQYAIPDSLFFNLEKESGSRTHALKTLFLERNLTLEQYFKRAFDEILETSSSGEIKAVFHVLEPFRSLVECCRINGLNLVPFIFSAVRKVHGYTNTLNMIAVNQSLFDTEFCRCLSERFEEEIKSTEVRFFSRESIIALLGKERTLPLIPLISRDADHQLLICSDAYDLTPYTFFNQNMVCDDDLHYFALNQFSRSEIRVRPHPLKLEKLGAPRSFVPFDPAATILSCERTISVCSQISLKAILWNRTAIIPKNNMPLSLLCPSDIESTDKVKIEHLNFYLFCFLVPDKLMFDPCYWQWRIDEGPCAIDLMRAHLSVLLSSSEYRSFDPKVVHCDFEIGYTDIMERRGFSRDVARFLRKPGIDEFSYDFAVSQLDLISNGAFVKSMWRLNSTSERSTIVESRFEITEWYSECNPSVHFYPFVDRDGHLSVSNAFLKIDGEVDVALKLADTSQVVSIRQVNGFIEFKLPMLQRQYVSIEIFFVWSPHSASGLV